MVKQKLSTRYVDKQALNRMLTQLFGSGAFEIEVPSLSGPGWNYLR